MTKKITPKLVALSGLTIFCVVYAINSYYSYSVSMVGDIHLYLTFTRALLHGSFTIANPLYALLSTHFPACNSYFTTGTVLSDGTLVSAVTIGTHLLLAPFVWLGGDTVFWTAPVFYDLILILSLFFLTRAFFASRYPTRLALAWYAALMAIALYGTLVNFRLNLRRDTLCAALFCLLSFFLFKALQSNRFRYWQVSFLLISLLTMTKIYFAFLYLPSLALLVWTWHHQPISFKKAAHQILLALIINFVFFIPFMMQNHAGTGHWLAITQNGYSQFYVKEMVARSLWAMITNTFDLLKIQSVFFIPDGVPAIAAVITLLVLLIGIGSQRKSPFVVLWLLPNWLFLYVFFIIWHQSHPGEDFAYNIYLSPTYPVSMFFIVCGMVFLIERFFKVRWILPTIALMVLLPFLSIKIYRSLPAHRHVRFQLPHAMQLTHDLHTIIPVGSVVLCDKFLSLSIDYFAKVHCFPPSRLGTGSGDLAKKINYLIDNGKAVFITDYRGIEGGYSYVDSLRTLVELEPVTAMQPLYNYPSEFEDGYITIYRIERKQDNELQ